MRLFIDLDSRRVVSSLTELLAVSELEIKRGTTELVQIQFFRVVDGVGVAELLATDSVLRFMVKAKGLYDGDAVVFSSTFSTPGSTSGYYEATVSTNTTELNALLFSPDSDDTNDVASVDLMAEVSWKGPSEDVFNKSSTFDVLARNAVDNGLEGTPIAGGPALGASLAKSATQSIPTGVATKVTFNSARWDDGAFFDDTADSLVIAETGRYFVSASIAADEAPWTLSLYKNGTLHAVLASAIPSDVSTLSGSGEFALTAADYIQLYATQSTGSSQVIANGESTRFAIYRTK